MFVKKYLSVKVRIFRASMEKSVDIAARTDRMNKPVDMRIPANSEKSEHFAHNEFRDFRGEMHGFC